MGTLETPCAFMKISLVSCLRKNSESLGIHGYPVSIKRQSFPGMGIRIMLGIRRSQPSPTPPPHTPQLHLQNCDPLNINIYIYSLHVIYIKRERARGMHMAWLPVLFIIERHVSRNWTSLFSCDFVIGFYKLCIVPGAATMTPQWYEPLLHVAPLFRTFWTVVTAIW